jgi:hypothetical protein
MERKADGYESLHGHIYNVWLEEQDRVLRVRDVRFWEGKDRPYVTIHPYRRLWDIERPDQDVSGAVVVLAMTSPGFEGGEPAVAAALS